MYCFHSYICTIEWLLRSYVKVHIIILSWQDCVLAIFDGSYIKSNSRVLSVGCWVAVVLSTFKQTHDTQLWVTVVNRRIFLLKRWLKCYSHNNKKNFILSKSVCFGYAMFVVNGYHFKFDLCIWKKVRFLLAP